MRTRKRYLEIRPENEDRWLDREIQERVRRMGASEKVAALVFVRELIEPGFSYQVLNSVQHGKVPGV